ncbi:hypothetical protein ACTXT7_005599 [Hymenolepis weldensis]
MHHFLRSQLAARIRRPKKHIKPSATIITEIKKSNLLILKPLSYYGWLYDYIIYRPGYFWGKGVEEASEERVYRVTKLCRLMVIEAIVGFKSKTDKVVFKAFIE